MIKHTIIDNATDIEYTDTLKNLINMVNNCNSTSALDYTFIRKNNFNQNPNFEWWLKYQGYKINFQGQILTEKESK
tara:strand:+ start:567 stop:794 length:228 start_codon:yes stop_codon:yes gene_type:complete